MTILHAGEMCRLDVRASIGENDTFVACATDGTIYRAESFDLGVSEFVQIINSKDDFPTPVNDVITLENNVKYIINSAIDMGVCQLQPAPQGQNQIEAANELAYPLTSNLTGGTPFIIGDFGRLILNDLDILSGTGTGNLFDINTTVTPLGIVSMQRMRIQGFASLGTIDGAISLVQNVAFVANADGITLNDTGPSFNTGIDWNTVNFVAQGGDHVTVTGQTNTLRLTRVTGAPSTGDGLFYFDPGITINTGTVAETSFSSDNGGTFLAAGSLDQTDVNFRFSDNLNFPDSTVIGSTGFTGGSTETVISTINTDVQIAGTYVAGNLERFTHSGGVLTYIGKEPITIGVSGFAQFNQVAGLENERYETAVFVNGVRQAATVIGKTLGAVFQTPTSQNFAREESISLVTNDTIDLRVRSTTGTDNITATDATLVVR